MAIAKMTAYLFIVITNDKNKVFNTSFFSLNEQMFQDRFIGDW